MIGRCAMRKAVCLTLGPVLLWNEQASAEESSPVEAAKSETSVSAALEEFFGPYNPTFSLIGAADSTILRPQSPKSLAAGILNGLDEEGNLKSGLAIEFAPGLLFAPRSFDLTDYQAGSKLQRSLRSLQVTAGFASGSNDDDKSLKASLGLVWTPINGMDVKAPTQRAICIKTVATSTYNPNTGKLEAVALEEVEAAVKKCKADHPLTRYNTTTLQFAFSPLFVSPDGSADKLKSQGYAASGTLMVGLANLFGYDAGGPVLSDIEKKEQAERRGLVVITGFYRKNEQVADPATKGAFLSRNRWSLASRIQFAVSGNSYFGIEGAYQRARYADGRIDKFQAATATYDFRVAKALWMSLNLGTSFSKEIGKDAVYLGTKFKWSFAKESTQGGLFE